MELYNPILNVIPIGFNERLFYIVQDRSVIGGTKTRGLYTYLKDKPEYDEFVYAGPSNGNAQFALAYCCSLLGKKATVFLSSVLPSQHTKPTLNALKYNVQIGGKFVYLKQAEENAKNYVQLDNKRFLCPFGLADEIYINHLEMNIKMAIPKEFTPKNIWLTVGSGTILRTLLRIFPNVNFKCVIVGKKIWEDQFTPEEWNRITIFYAPEKFVQGAEFRPPYLSITNYDAKVWRFVRLYAEDKDYIWNVY